MKGKLAFAFCCITLRSISLLSIFDEFSKILPMIYSTEKVLKFLSSKSRMYENLYFSRAHQLFKAALRFLSSS